MSKLIPFRANKEIQFMLNYLVKQTGWTKSDVIRSSLAQYYDDVMRWLGYQQLKN